LQLEGYLESLYRYFPAELIQTYLIYKPELFGQQYEEVFRKYSDCEVVREQDFSHDFLKLLDSINTEYLLFGVDDVVYFDTVDFDIINETFERHSEDIFGFSLRLGSNVLGNGKDSVRELAVAGQKVCRLEWPSGKTPNTKYPFELCATIYRSELVKRIIQSSRRNSPFLEKFLAPGSLLMRALGSLISTRSILKSFGYFYSPNTLESWNCRWSQRNAAALPGGLYFQKLCASAIQVNMVNTSTRNQFAHDCEYTVEALNDKYKQGYRLDINFVTNNKPESHHSDKQHFVLCLKN
jgi:hypothetical protein